MDMYVFLNLGKKIFVVEPLEHSFKFTHGQQ